MVVLTLQSAQRSCERTVKGLLVLHAVRWHPIHNPINCNQLGTYDNPKKPTPTARLPSTSSTKGPGKDKESDLLVADGQHVRLWHIADSFRRCTASLLSGQSGLFFRSPTCPLMTHS